MSERMSAAQFRTTAKRPNKFGAVRSVLDGIAFDSKAEATYYANLRLREIADEVTQVEMQKPYTLTVEGRLLGVYRADFAFFDVVEDRYRVIDVKGHDTPLSRWKRKHVKAQYGIDVEIVK